MKNRKNGFTMIELLMVIVVMGLVGVIATVSLSHTLTQTNQRKCDEFVLEVEESACVYSGLANKEVVCKRPGCEIKLDVLVRNGHIKSETDACTGGNIDLTQTVTVTWNNNGEKICTYNGDRTYGE